MKSYHRNMVKVIWHASFDCFQAERTNIFRFNHFWTIFEPFWTILNNFKPILNLFWNLEVNLFIIPERAFLKYIFLQN